MFLPFAFNLLIWIIGGYGLTNSYSFVLNVFSFDDEKIVGESIGMSIG